MKRILISESNFNSLQKLAGIIKENAAKIQKLGFSEPISNYLAAMDKKRGMVLADLITRDYFREIDKPELANQNLKPILANIEQDGLFDYIKSREGDIKTILQWVRQNQGVNIKSFNTFNDLITAAIKSQNTTQSDEDNETQFTESVDRFLRKIDYDAGPEIGRLALISYAKHNLKDEKIYFDKSFLLSLIDQDAFLSFLYENENQMYNISDWLSSPVFENTPQSSNKALFIKNGDFEDLEDLLTAAMEWHSNLTASGKILDPTKGKVVRRYPDGLFWIDLETNVSLDEGQAMGHCGRDSRATTLFSLRDTSNQPHVTIAYNEDTKIVAQVKGKKNEKPVDKYMRYVMEFLKDMAANNELVNFIWSYGEDLDDKEIEEVFKVNKKAYFRYLKNKTSSIRSNLATVYENFNPNNTFMKKKTNETTDEERYEEVVFMQGEEADEPLQILDLSGEDAAIKYLMQWHDPGNHMGRNDLGHGTSDRTYEKDGYILSYNTRLGYIGLVYDTEYDESKQEMFESVRANIRMQLFENVFNTVSNALSSGKMDEYSERTKEDYPWYCAHCDEELQGFEVTFDETCTQCGQDVVPNEEAADYNDMEPEEFSGMMEGLWDNIHAKRKRGEKPAKPGNKDYPDSKAWEKAQKSEGASNWTKKQAEALYDKGMQIFYKGDFEEAEKLRKQAIRKYPADRDEFTPYTLSEGGDELSEEEWDEANALLEKADGWEECKPSLEEAKYQGRKVTLNKPMRGDVKKFKVYVKNDKGNVVKVNFGQKGVKIKKNNPKRRKSFRARHGCDNPGPKTSAKYWSCRKW